MKKLLELLAVVLQVERGALEILTQLKLIILQGHQLQAIK
jgi:hypothetical protein